MDYKLLKHLTVLRGKKVWNVFNVISYEDFLFIIH